MVRQIATRWGLVVAMFAAVAVVSATGCATGPDLTQMEYADQAEYIYRQGEEALENGRYIEANENFNTVRNEYPYSRWAAMANLRIGDAYFEQQQYASAVQQYRGFVDLYPRHEQVEYARWRVALAFYEQMPSDFVVFPPPHERDLSTTRDAAREMRIFLREFEDSDYADEAREKWREAMTRLARHELYVANHYMERDNPRATVWRTRYLLENFSGFGLDAEALYLLGSAHQELEQPDRAASAWRDLMEYHSDHPRAAEAQRRLEQL